MNRYRTILSALALVLVSTSFCWSQATKPSTSSNPDEDARRIADVLAATQAQYDAVLQDLQSTEQKLQNETSRVDVTHRSLETYANTLEQELDTLMLEHVGAQARTGSIEEAIAEQTARAQKQVTADEVAQELQKVVDARIKQFERTQQASRAAAVPTSAVDEAEANVAEARARLAERRQTMFATAGGDLLSALNRELLMLNIAEQERNAKIQYVKGQLDRIRPSLNSSRAMDRLEQQSLDIFKDEQALRRAIRNELAARQNSASNGTANAPGAAETKPKP